MKYNYAICLTDAWHSGTYPSQISDYCGQSQAMLLLTETKHQLSVFDAMPIVHRSFHACLIFSSDRAVTEGRFE